MRVFLLEAQLALLTFFGTYAGGYDKGYAVAYAPFDFNHIALLRERWQAFPSQHLPTKESSRFLTGSRQRRYSPAFFATASNWSSSRKIVPDPSYYRGILSSDFGRQARGKPGTDTAPSGISNTEYRGSKRRRVSVAESMTLQAATAETDGSAIATQETEPDGDFKDGLAVTSRVWGTTAEGDKVHRIDLQTIDGFSASFITYGATLLSLKAGDDAGSIEEVTLQYDTLDGVIRGDAYYGATIGRVCNRIGGGMFDLDGRLYTMVKNNGSNCLHGGSKGFDKVIWRHEVYRASGRVGVIFFYHSPDGEEGFPGAMDVQVTYAIARPDHAAEDSSSVPVGTGVLHTEMEATLVPEDGISQQGHREKSPINLTNHAYWNLSGGGKRSAREHLLTLQCDRYLPLDANQIPTGTLCEVSGTYFDFTRERLLGEAIEDSEGDPPGLDNCLVAMGTESNGRSRHEENGGGPELPLLARLREPKSGRIMEVFGSQPALQVYTANFLSTDPGKGEDKHKRHNAICLETQHFPDAVNQPDWRRSVMLYMGETYLQRARHEFSVSNSGQ